MGTADHDHRFAVSLPGRTLTVVGRPGVWSWQRLDPGTAALLQVAEVGATEQVLDLGCGSGVIPGDAAGL